MRRLAVALLAFAMAVQLNSKGKTASAAHQKPRQTNRLIRGADLVLLNGRIWTGDPVTKPGPREGFGPWIEAVAIASGRFLAGGTTEQIHGYVGDHAQVIELGGRLAVPGFIDSHVHFLSGGFHLMQVQLNDVPSESEFLRRLEEKAKSLPAGRWITGGNWDEEDWPDAKLPTRWLIDPVTREHPVFVSRYDGHSGLANSLALKLAGVTKDTRDPEGGIVVRDAKTGEPTGVLKDTATDLVENVIPPPTESEAEEALKAALAEARRVGVTSIHNIASDAGGSAGGSFAGEIRLLRRAEAEGWLTVRIYELVPIARWRRLEEAGVSRGMGSEFLKLGAIKAFADGSLGSATAWMFEPFSNDPSSRGLPMPLMVPASRMDAEVRGADQADVQVAVHAIGDRAVAEMLDIFERVGGGRAASRRFRIEHAQHVRPADFERFAKLGVIASMQPSHAIDDGRWAEKRIGHERARRSYAWRSMLRAGARLAFGSDWPVEPLDPMLGLYGAVTRATLDGKHPGGWIPEERISLEEALRAFTQGSAYAAFEENEKGTISPGKLADLVVLSEDLWKIPPEEIKDARVVLTLVGGKVVYRTL